MTFREKLAKEHPEFINERHDGGCKDCPHTYGYEILNDSDDCPEGGNCTKCWDREIPKTYEKGLQDAWELVKKAYDYTCDELEEIFGVKYGFHDFISKFTYQEALAKLKAYEDSQEIKAGDVVRCKGYPSTEILITSTERSLNGLHLQSDEGGRKGEAHSFIDRNAIEKTGKHIDIESLLEQIWGAE